MRNIRSEKRQTNKQKQVLINIFTIWYGPFSEDFGNKLKEVKKVEESVKLVLKAANRY